LPRAPRALHPPPSFSLPLSPSLPPSPPPSFFRVG
jgi:hypothetical protein